MERKSGYTPIILTEPKAVCKEEKCFVCVFVVCVRENWPGCSDTGNRNDIHDVASKLGVIVREHLLILQRCAVAYCYRTLIRSKISLVQHPSPTPDAHTVAIQMHPGSL